MERWQRDRERRERLKIDGMVGWGSERERDKNGREKE